MQSRLTFRRRRKLLLFYCPENWVPTVRRTFNSTQYRIIFSVFIEWNKLRGMKFARFSFRSGGSRKCFLVEQIEFLSYFNLRFSLMQNLKRSSRVIQYEWSSIRKPNTHTHRSSYESWANASTNELKPHRESRVGTSYIRMFLIKNCACASRKCDRMQLLC